MSGPIPAQKSLYRLAAEGDREDWWCACRRNTSQPLCDCSHKGTGLTPAPLILSEANEVWLCGCKVSGGKPLCDDTHARL
jgi:CDGSH iron-sulfur domain-containing protein 3